MARRKSFSPTIKYWGEQHDRYGGPVCWSGTPSGLPIRTPGQPLLTPRELAQLPVVGQKFVGTFDLADEEQKNYYVWVMDRIRNGLFTEDYIERHWDSDEKKMVIYLEWTQLYATIPPGYAVQVTGTNDQFTLRKA